ncbi:hypothetical protein SAMN02746073_1146 [Legionella jamestowniensis DSM 19215]|uniref:Uncharacterized protein n=1 Tax=Legionella jamestowniensis TaxID=455 RepID=A0A0W0UIV7_9GAMM|nr:hypothetical protein Ljam_2021 [Legionella jamestowniensis]SFL62723.1 hypothetical protein SAMN02746073_1146 [Legionella jamestowniensis DSM 19215]
MLVGKCYAFKSHQNLKEPALTQELWRFLPDFPFRISTNIPLLKTYSLSPITYVCWFDYNCLLLVDDKLIQIYSLNFALEQSLNLTQCIWD